MACLALVEADVGSVTLRVEPENFGQPNCKRRRQPRVDLTNAEPVLYGTL